MVSYGFLIENGGFPMVFPVKMVIFHSFVELTEGWVFQDAIDGGTLVPHNLRPYVEGIFSYIRHIYIGLIYGKYLQSSGS